MQGALRRSVPWRPLGRRRIFSAAVPLQFGEFQALAERIGGHSGRLAKSEALRAFTESRRLADGDAEVLLRLLLPRHDPRRYRLKDRALLSRLARVYGAEAPAMREHLERCGVISATAEAFFARPPAYAVPLMLSDVDCVLSELDAVAKADEQVGVLRSFAERCSAADMMWLVRLVKKDLRIGAGDKTVMDGIHPEAHAQFQRTSDLAYVVGAWQSGALSDPAAAAADDELRPIQPMLAKAHGDLDVFESRFERGGTACEVKYDGERVQIHKDGDELRFYSRNLKPVNADKIDALRGSVESALQGVDRAILDAELLLIDERRSGRAALLPFGSVGVHQQAKHECSALCLFVFDVMRWGEDSVTHWPFERRRALLEGELRAIPQRVELSEMELLRDREHLSSFIDAIIDEGLEGVVLKDVREEYEPGKRRWLKMKRDYLDGGAMADSADLVVLGGYFGTGKMGGKISVFLMGCWDTSAGLWKTVCKCGNGLDDERVEQLQTAMAMVKISRSAADVPEWLDVTSTLTPDFVVEDPMESLVLQITGTEFTESTSHSADGISIRFPRVTCERDDKDPATATTLGELVELRDSSTAHVRSVRAAQ